MLSVTERLPGESAKDYVVRQMIHNIVHLNLLPGQQLDAKQLCEAFHVSKNPLREAELELSQTKLIEIKPKIGAYVSLIDIDIVEEVRELRCVLEQELAIQACDLLAGEQIDQLWENVALWQMYIKRGQEEKIFQLDKEFHGLIYKMCNKNYWNSLVESIAPHFDRTTVLSFRCKLVDKIFKDHEELVHAIEQKDKEKAAMIAQKHLSRYSENLSIIQKEYSNYFKVIK